MPPDVLAELERLKRENDRLKIEALESELRLLKLKTGMQTETLEAETEIGPTAAASVRWAAVCKRRIAACERVRAATACVRCACGGPWRACGGLRRACGVSVRRDNPAARPGPALQPPPCRRYSRPGRTPRSAPNALRGGEGGAGVAGSGGGGGCWRRCGCGGAGVRRAASG